jgi:hypothetical protein
MKVEWYERDQVSALFREGSRNAAYQGISWQEYLLADRAVFDPVYQSQERIDVEIWRQLRAELDAR